MKLRVNFPKIVLIFMLFLAMVSPMVHALKVVRISYEVGAYVFYIGLPLVTAIIWGCLLRGRHFLPLPLFFLLLLGLMLSTFLSMVYGGDWFDMAGNFTRLLFCIGMVQFSVVYRRDILGFLGRHERTVAFLALISTSIAVIGLYAASFIGFGVYFGLQSTLAFVALSYGLVYKSSVFAIGAVILIVLSGKRGAMVGAVAVILAYLFFLLYSRQAKRFVVILLALFFVSFTAFFAGLIPESILSRFDQFTSGETTDWNKATAGRMTEVEGVFEVFEAHPEVLIHGLGLGAAIEDPSGVSDSTIHFSPFGLILLWGLPLTILFYMSMFYYAIKGFYVAGRANYFYRKSMLFWSLILTGELVFSFSAFTILQSMMLWLAAASVMAFATEWSVGRRSAQPL